MNGVRESLLIVASQEIVALKYVDNDAHVFAHSGEHEEH